MKPKSHRIAASLLRFLNNPEPSPAQVLAREVNTRTLVAVTACGLLVAGLGASACSNPDPGPAPPQFGSETNFLRYCSDDECGDGLVCNCGVCTRACDDATQCSELAEEATCVALPVASERPSCQALTTCEVECIRSADCAALDGDYSCQAGVCRKGEQQCASATATPGDFTREVTVGGVTRSFNVHVPASYAGQAPAPLVLDFHAMGMTAEWERNNSGLLELSDQEGFVGVWPVGLDNTWNVGPCCGEPNVDDFTFVTTLVKELSTEACIDQRAIYATGFSFGGAMAYYLVCQHAEVFAAAAVSSMDLFASSEVACNPSRPVSVIAFRGTDDPVIPYAGGLASPPGQPGVQHEFQGAVGTFQTWAALNQCAGEPSAPDAEGCSSYQTCASDTQVTLCTLDGQGQVHGDAALMWSVIEQYRLP